MTFINWERKGNFNKSLYYYPCYANVQTFGNLRSFIWSWSNTFLSAYVHGPSALTWTDKVSS